MLLQKMNFHEVQTQKHFPGWTKKSMEELPQWPGSCKPQVGKVFLTEEPVAGSTGPGKWQWEGLRGSSFRPESSVCWR